jgi:hypothetical protein
LSIGANGRECIPWGPKNSLVTRWTSKDPTRFHGGINQCAYVFNDPVNRRDPTGLDVWVEGSNPHEAGLGLHESIAVGDPNGTYSSWSYGATGFFWGSVYIDTQCGGTIVSDMYLHTTPEEDLEIMDTLNSLVGSSGLYCPGLFSCREWSQDQFGFFKDLGYGTLATPPERSPENSNPWAPSTDSIWSSHTCQ